MERLLFFPDAYLVHSRSLSRCQSDIEVKSNDYEESVFMMNFRSDVFQKGPSMSGVAIWWSVIPSHPSITLLLPCNFNDVLIAVKITAS